MREWLSRREWCDARLVCRGRVFCAHRAVLASVSPYLRLLLKSHSDEDTPAYLVLPDFDLDAMSAVLHYIYNGEVSLPTNRVNSFFDVITTLQIFVDLKSLLNVKAKLEDINIEDADESLLGDEDIDDLECYTSLTKTKHKRDLLKLETQINHLIKRNITVDEEKDECGPCDDVIDKEIRSRHPTRSELRPRKQRPSVRAENVRVQDEYQEKSSPLRDPPAEPRPRSDRTNGPPALAAAPAVPAITIESYHDAGSMHASREVIADTVLIRDDQNDSTRSEIIFPESNKEMVNALSTRNSYINSNDNMKENNRWMWKEMYSLDNSLRQSAIENKKSDIRRPNPLRPVPTLLPISLCERRPYVRQLPPLLDLTSVHLLPASLHPAYRENWSPSIQRVDSIFEGEFNTRKEYLRDHSGKIQFDRNVHPGRIKNSNAVSIQKKSAFNQVLASPWCPRVPNCYRPQPNKITRLSPPRCSTERQAQVETKNEENKSPSNDRNNNVRSPQSPRDLNQETETCLEQNSHSIAVITTKDELKCGVCDKKFSSSDGLSAHARVHAGGAGASARHTCSECGKTFSQLRNYKYHVSVHRGTREFAATCSVCGKYFNDRGYLSSHMKIHRNRKEYECPHCPKSFNQRVAYNMHVRIHTGIKPHVCSECGKAFSRKMLLKQHQRTHSGERPYACSVCDKRFADRSNMTLHMRLHSGLKPFACTLCPKSFTKKHHLKTHLNYHTGDKPYSCPRCHLAFSQSSNMRTHLKKCSVPEPSTPT